MSCQRLAHEFRRENLIHRLDGGSKDDVLELSNQLLHAFYSLRRPLEDAREEYEQLQIPQTSADVPWLKRRSQVSPMASSSESQQERPWKKPRKLRDRVGVNDRSRDYKCPHRECRNDPRRYLDFGLKDHA